MDRGFGGTGIKGAGAGIEGRWAWVEGAESGVKEAGSGGKGGGNNINYLLKLITENKVFHFLRN